MLVSECLIAAKTLLSDPNKWTKNSFAKTENGTHVPPNDKDAVCYCSIGAISAIIPEEYHAYYTSEERYKFIKDSLNTKYVGQMGQYLSDTRIKTIYNNHKKDSINTRMVDSNDINNNISKRMQVDTSAVTGVTSTPPHRSFQRLLSDCRQYLMKACFILHGTSGIMTFNDMDSTTHADIMLVYDQAIYNATKYEDKDNA